MCVYINNCLCPPLSSLALSLPSLSLSVWEECKPHCLFHHEIQQIRLHSQHIHIHTHTTRERDAHKHTHNKVEKKTPGVRIMNASAILTIKHITRHFSAFLSMSMHLPWTSLPVHPKCTSCLHAENAYCVCVCVWCVCCMCACVCVVCVRVCCMCVFVLYVCVTW